LTVGLDLLKESGLGILGLGEEQVLTITYLTFIILGISIALKLWLGLFYRSIAKKIDSSVIKASSADCFSDCISTAAVILSSVVIKLTDVQMVDSIVGLAVSVLILVAGIKILNETKNSILGEAPVEQTVKAIEDIAANYDSIVGIHDMMVHNYGPNHYIASFHAEVNGEDDIYELHDAIDNAEQEIFAKLGIVCTIHLDPIAVNDEETNELKCLAIEAARSVDNDITIHDFRAVIGNTHTNLIFDIVLPFESKLTEKEAIAAVSCAVSELRKDVNCVIKVDRG
jgi:cation diffusion facilitator family transporter